MATYLFAWNPSLWNWPELPSDIRKLRRRGHVDLEWSAGRTRNIEVGSRAFFVRVGVQPKGIFGAGHTLSAPTPILHWRPEKAAAGVMTQHLRLRLEALFPLPPVLYEDLAEPPFARFRWGVRASGVRVPTALADALEDLWEARVRAAAKTLRQRQGCAGTGIGVSSASTIRLDLSALRPLPMAALESLTFRDGIGTFRPRGRYSLVDAVSLVATAIAQCRTQGVPLLLVDATGFEGLPIPSLLDRFLMVEDWAAEANGMVAMAMVAEPQYIHPRKFGVTVARHLGMVCDVFESEPEAVAWMTAMAGEAGGVQ